jgi:antitoxin VapB
MALSTRNPRAEQLAREVAAASGENITQAIIHALEERLERLRGRRTATDTVQEITAISQRCSALPDLDPRAPEEILGYNRFGAIE